MPIQRGGQAGLTPPKHSLIQAPLKGTGDGQKQGPSQWGWRQRKSLRGCGRWGLLLICQWGLLSSALNSSTLGHCFLTAEDARCQSSEDAPSGVGQPRPPEGTGQSPLPPFPPIGGSGAGNSCSHQLTKNIAQRTGSGRDITISTSSVVFDFILMRTSRKLEKF